MKKKIEGVLREAPGLKGRQIAKKLGLERREVNSYLNKQDGIFFKDDNHCWFIAKDSCLEIQLVGDAWFDGMSLD